jgi:hypothetical protein
MQIHNVEQKSPEWFALRLQYPLTASKAQAIGNQGKGLETLCWEQLSKKYSSSEADKYTNGHLERGVELEPQAVSIYELKTGNTVKTVGFITNEAISNVGGVSPDGLINEDGNLEVKCFDDAKYFKMLVDFKAKGDFEIESGYIWQMQMQMLFNGRLWTDFVAYNPNYSESMLIKRVYPDAVMQQKLITGLKMGEKIINDIESKLK